MAEAHRGLSGRLRKGMLGAVAAASIGAGAEFPSPASAAEPVEDRTEQPAGDVFHTIERSYQQFDTKNAAAIQAQYKLYEKNQNIIDQLPALQQAEFYREWAYTEYVSVGVQYDLSNNGSQVNLLKLEARNPYKANDTLVLQNAMGKVDKSIALANPARVQDVEQVEQKSTILYKAEGLKRDIEAAIDAINADLPIAVEKKEAMIEAIREAIGQEASEFVVRGPTEQLYISIDVEVVKGSRHSRDQITLMYDYETGKVKVNVGSYLRNFQPAVDMIVSRQK